MKKYLGKSIQNNFESIEAFRCSCTCSCTCGGVCDCAGMDYYNSQSSWEDDRAYASTFGSGNSTSAGVGAR